LLPEVFPELGSIFAPNAKIIHIDLDTDAIAKNHPVNLGMLGDPKVSLAALAQLLDEVMTDEQKQGAIARRDALAARKTAEHAYQLEADRAIREDVPLHFSRFAEELAKQLPDDAIIFDEALTCSPQFTRYYPPSRPGHYFLTRGGSLGVGIPGAIGAQLAYPNKTVVGITGDGGSMYTIQALWTAARHHINAKFIICNNRSYRLLQLNVAEYWKAQGVAPHDFPLSFDLSQPVLRFDEMARSMGVPGLRVEKPDEIAPAIQAAFAHNGPFLLDVVLEGDVRPDLVSDRCG
jgi:benzoylformate decarboxylase